MRRLIALLLLLCVVSPFCENAFSQVPDSLNPGSKYVQAQLIAEQKNVQPAEGANEPSARVGILLTIEPGWHTYWRNSGEAALPTKVEWRLPDGWRAGPLQWPAPLRISEKGNITTFGYTNETLLWSDVFAPQIVPGEGEKVKFAATVKFLVCKDVCVPGKQAVELELPFTTSLAQQSSGQGVKFAKYVALSPRAQPAALKLSGVTSTTTLAPGSTNTGGLLLEPFILPKGVDVPNNIQIFPYAHPFITAKSPSVITLPVKTGGSGILVTFPVDIKSSATAGETILQGVVILSSALTETKDELAVEWSLPILVDSKTPAVENPNFPKGAASPAPLLYRTAHFTEAGAKVSDPPALPPGQSEPLTAAALLFALLTAFIGGLILNLMPCVLPIISIKILGFVGQKDQSRRSALVSSLFFSLGILSTFLALAFTIILLRSLGKELAWGFQFHHPEFVFGLLLVVFFLSLALFDLYSFQLPFMQSANKAASTVRSPHLKHFFDGVLATALSTPCTAPIFGTALAFAFAQPPPVTILVFLAIGSGLAFPYILLSTNPRLMRLVPQPGDWMFRFRALMGFFLLGTVVWLLGILQSLNSQSAVWTVLLLLIIFFAVWYRRSLRESGSTTEQTMRLKTIPLLLLVVVSFYYLTPKILGHAEAESIEWQAFTPELMKQGPASGKALFVDFTAAWCVTCKFNEYFIISSSEVTNAIKQYGITPVKADWTNGDEAITEALRAFGAEGVPFYAVIPAGGGEPITLSTLPSPSSLVEAFKKASTKK